MVLLHNENTMDSAVWSFLYMYMPLNICVVSSTSTVSIESHVHINPKIKLQMGADLSGHFSEKYNFIFT